MHKILKNLQKSHIFEDLQIPQTTPFKDDIHNLLENKTLFEKKFIEILSDSNLMQLQKILKLLNQKKFNERSLISNSAQKDFTKILEHILESILNEKNKNMIEKILIRQRFFSFFKKGFNFNKKIMIFSTQNSLEAFLESFLIKQRLNIYLQIVHKKPQPLYNIMIKSQIFRNDLEEMVKNPQKFEKMLKYSKLFFLNVSQNIWKEILTKIHEITLEEMKKFSSRNLSKIILLLESFEKDFTKKQDFYFNLKLLRSESSSLLTPRDLLMIHKKIKRRFEFFDEELELIVKSLLKIEPFQWDLKTIKQISILLNNEYYVFQYYTEFTKKLRLVLIDNGKLSIKGLKDEMRRLAILKAMKLRFPKDFFDDILNKYSIFVRDYILLKISNEMIKLCLGPEHLKTPIILETFQAIERMKIYEESLNLSNLIKKAQFWLLISNLLFYKTTFKDEHEILLKTLKEISQTTNDLEPQLKKDLSFFLYNALPLLKSKDVNKKLLEQCEKIEKSFVFFQNPGQKPFLTISKPEKNLMKIFEKLTPNYSIKSNYAIGPYHVDFYLESKKLIIEYHGLQHFYL